MGSVGNVCARAWLVVCLTSCAQGFTDDPLATSRPGIGTGTGESGSASPDLGAGMGATAQTGRMAYTGEACEMGETAPCTCSPQGTPGTKSCRYDRASPTMGTFSECGNCAAPGDEMPDPGDVMTSGSGGGTAGRAGSGSAGRGGTGGSPGAGGSTGSSGSGGSDGSGGTSGGTRGCMPACNNTCFPVGILPCCTTGGRCGCTWAPGAYCL